MEKTLPVATGHRPPPPPKSLTSRVCSTLVVAALALYCLKDPALRWYDHFAEPAPAHDEVKAQCAQPIPLFPPTDNEDLERMWEFLSTPAFRNGTVARHSGAVQIPTQSFDDLGKIGEDKRWDAMFPFADYLEATFPRVHKNFKLDKVNTHGLAYTWQGSDDSLKPLILMAHQDVVPVPDETIDAWTHPPFSGFYDGQFIWGRGSSDCKNQLIAIMETMELFLEAGYKPKRTIVLSFGFDEEISGREGGGHLASFLLDRYGKNGIAAIVDEGAGFTQEWGSLFAIPGVAEKGYTDVHITVRTPGGHSSIPTDHTSIGVLSEIITAIEAEQYPTYLASENPVLGLLQCGASHAPEFPKKLKKLLRNHRPSINKHKDYLALEAAKMGRPTQYLMQTSQAVDVIKGGVKVNALPERVTVTVNHRVNIGDEPKMVWDHLTKLAKPVAKKYNLTLHAFDGVNEEASSISLWPEVTTLKVAPVTPTDVDAVTPFAILAGTTRAIYGEHVVVSPGMTTGNTDTRYFWDLTPHIFRYGPGYDPDVDPGLRGVHTVDEKASVRAHISMVKWFTLFVRNMDDAQLE